MASIRWTILQALEQRLATLDRWHPTLRRDLVQWPANVDVLALIYALGESKTLAASNLYDATLTVGVEIFGKTADADDTLDGDGTAGSANPYSYLDRLVVQAEQLIHTPDAWGLDPAFTDVRVEGHDIFRQEDGQENYQVSALLRLTFNYRHSIEDPEQ